MELIVGFTNVNNQLETTIFRGSSLLEEIFLFQAWKPRSKGGKIRMTYSKLSFLNFTISFQLNSPLLYVTKSD